MGINYKAFRKFFWSAASERIPVLERIDEGGKLKQIVYFPGCGLKQGAKGYEISLQSTLAKLGVEAVELEGWNCCGAVYPLSTDRLMNRIAPLRNLIKTRDQGVDELFVPCSMCYGVLKQTEKFARTSDDMERINEFIDDLEDYHGGVEVNHISELLARLVDKFTVKDRINSPVEGIKLAPYYGCTLTRPSDFAVPEGIFEHVLRQVGFQVVDYPEKERCCGTFHGLGREGVVEERGNQIIASIEDRDVSTAVISCPLCEYNLGQIASQPLSLIWITQAVGMGLGKEVEELGLSENISAGSWSGLETKGRKIEDRTL